MIARGGTTDRGACGHLDHRSPGIVNEPALWRCYRKRRVRERRRTASLSESAILQTPPAAGNSQTDSRLFFEAGLIHDTVHLRGSEEEI